MISRVERRRRERGFTLIELMSTVALIGVIALLAMPNLTGMYHRMSLGSTMRTLYAGFIDAQSRARSTGIKHRIVLDRTNDQYQIVSMQNPASPVVVNTRTLDNTGKLTFRGEGYTATFPAPYGGVPKGTWCTFCGDKESASGYIQFDAEGLLDSASVMTNSNGSITLYDSTGATGAVESLVFMGHTGDIRLFRTGS